MKYFSYSPCDGFDFHETEQEAAECAGRALEFYRDGAAAGWDDDVKEVCWGVVSEVTRMTSEREPDPGSGCDYYCDYELTEITDDACVPLALVPPNVPVITGPSASHCSAAEIAQSTNMENKS